MTDEEFKEIEQLLYKVCITPYVLIVGLLIVLMCSMTHCSSGMLIFHLRSSTNSQRFVTLR